MRSRSGWSTISRVLDGRNDPRCDMELHASALKEGMLFLSNHRDIVLDPSLVNVALMESRREATDWHWIQPLVIDLGSSIGQTQPVFCGGTLGECKGTYNHSLTTAAYIQRAVSGTPVWLAHREGRSKDGRDATAPALIRTLSNNGDRHTWDALNVVPVSISYEWDRAMH